MSESFSNLGNSLKEWFENFKTDISNLGNSVGSWFSSLGDSINSKFNEWKEEKQREKEEKQKEKEEQKLKEEQAKKEEEEQKESSESQVGDIADNVQGVVGDKFGAFYTLKDFLSNFWNAIFEAEEEVPEFKITLPEFCGGGTYNVLDLSFYQQYRTYIHYLIAGICYFIYIKKIYSNLPNVIR